MTLNPTHSDVAVSIIQYPITHTGMTKTTVWHLQYTQHVYNSSTTSCQCYQGCCCSTLHYASYASAPSNASCLTISSSSPCRPCCSFRSWRMEIIPPLSIGRRSGSEAKTVASSDSATHHRAAIQPPPITLDAKNMYIQAISTLFMC
jgi:hypothetical protein